MNVEFSVQEVNLVNLFPEKETAGVKDKHTFYVSNRFGSSKKVRIALSKSSHPDFHLLSSTNERYLAAGLKLPVVLQHTPASAGAHTGEIQVYVNELLSFTIPIQALPPSPCIAVDSTIVDFGHLVSEHQITSRRFTVCNKGARDGGFSLTTHSLPPHFTLSATGGRLSPGQSLEIQVELVCKESGPFKEEIIVVPSDEASSPITLTVCGDLVTRQLQLLDSANSTVLNKISFSDTYYGTVVSRKALLYNNSPVATQYMAVLDRGGLGTVAGIDMSEGLAMACTSGGLGQSKWREQGDPPEMETVVSLNPSQGSLGPYQKIMVEFIFMPKILKSSVGWSQHQGIPLPRDYSLFVHFMQVGLSTGSSILEVALTGRACPVKMSLQPQGIINFGTCNTGSSSTIDLQVLNESQVLPIEYACRGLAHYKSSPRSGRLLPGEVTCLAVTFTPRQLGRLNCKLNIDVMSTRRETGGEIRNGAVYTAVIDLRGVGGVTTARKIKDKKIKLAHPNDLPTSVRPHDERNKGVIITPYTKMPRHTYVDPDYSLTDEEAIALAQHKNTYTDFIRDQQAEREWQKRNRTHTGGLSVDMNMAPAQGMTSPVVSTTDLTRGGGSKPERRETTMMMTTTDVIKATENQLEFVAMCPSKPVNGEVAAQCKKTLSPLELSQISIDPGVIDFGSVVVNSIAELNLSIKNHTSNHISLKMKLAGSAVTCTSCYGNKSTLQLIVPPQSYTHLPLIMSQKETGIIERSIEYTVNGQAGAHLPVKASVTQLSLLLSTNTLTLTEPPLARQSSGLLGSVVISNPHSIPVFFHWLAKEGVETSVFTMLHPSGYVPANGRLECGFVCLPSYQSPKTAEFLLDDGKDSLKDSPANILSLVTEFKKPVCNIREKRVLFGTIPLNLTTARTIHIDNTGDCHAYYKVLDSSPHPGLKVFPESGVVPRGGAASLHVLLCPETTGTIDIRVVVGLREGKTLGLRLAGLVEQPTLTVDQELFRFGSVFCGAKATQSFTVTNKGSTSAELTFNLTHLPDFSLLLPSSEDPYNESAAKSDGDGDGTYSIKIPGKSNITCKLEFCPKDVAAYDFLLPLLVNGLKAPAPPPSPWPPSRTSSFIAHSQGTGLSMPSFSLTPMRRVLATALRPPLVVPNLQFDFELTGDCDKPTRHHKALSLSNVSGEALSWALGRTAEYTRVEDGTFQLVMPSGQSFQPPVISLDASSEQEEEAECLLGPGESVSLIVLCRPGHHGKFSATLPLVVNGNTSQPYRTLVLTANFPTSSISVTPSCIDILPVPLGISLAAQFTVFVQGFTQPVELDIAVPAMRDGVCFSVCFPGGSRVESGDKVELPCTLEFSSTHPVSITDTIIFSDKTTGKQKVLPFTVCADNSLFSVYKFLAQNVHLSSVTLISNVPTFVLQSQDFEGSGRSSSVASYSSQGSVVKDTALVGNTSTTFSDMFHQDCVSAVCRWLSAYGWSDGIKCITLPSDLRRTVGNDLPKAGVKQRSSISTSRGLLVDMLTHLCGRVPPGIPLNLHPCTTASEMVNQQYSTLNTVISFLKNHGSLLWSVVPEALLDWCDYRQWLNDVGGKGSVGFQPGGKQEFIELSNQAWTHLLMQIVKVLLLPRAISHISKAIKETVSPSLESNVYSKHERVLLAWLNHHYTTQRGKLFKDTDMSLTDVLNFDVDLMDCTVFACVLVAYCPFLLESHLCQLFTEPVSHEQCTHNAIVLVQALRHAGIDYDLQPTDLVSADPISLLLFTVFLCQRLPAFKTKSNPIMFEGALDTNIKNQVQLTNPSTKSLDYHILIRGGSAGDFTVQDNTITVGGKRSCQLTVTYHTCCLSPAESTLLLVAKGGKAVAGSTLAFKLVGRITSFKPQSTVSLTAYQYECQSVSVKVLNTYSTAGKFTVTFYEMDDKTLANSLSAKSRKKLNTSAIARVPSFVLLRKSEAQMQQFHCALSQVTINPNEEKLIPVKFVPLKTTPIRCFMVLSDPSVGDLVLSLTSTVQSPRPSLPHTNHLNPHTLVNAHTHTLHLKVHAGQAMEEELVIHCSNKAFESALLEMSQWGMSDEELRRRKLTQSLRYASLSTAIAALGLETSTKRCQDYQSGESEVLYFTVQVSDQEHFALPEKIAVPAKNSGTAVIPVRFYSEMEGQFECYITLRSKHDVRVLVIETTVLATGRHAHIQFNTHAMQPLTQDIPLVNPSTADWPLIASLTGSGFSGPESLIAHALATTNYPLTFDPHSQGTVEGVLRLLNNSDDSEHMFHLTGIADKPLAQDHITLQANAKQSMTHILHVPNHNERTTVFRVESDLDFVSGPSTITVGGGDVVDYCLNVLPKSQGTFSGAIAFITEAVSRPHSYNDGLESTELEPTGGSTEKSLYRVWFQLEFVVGAAPPDHVLTMSTTTLSSTTLQLTIPNAHSQAICLQALVEGCGLSGPASLDIDAHGEASYPLTFTPTLHGKTDGRVVFSGSPEGEFWYQLVLSAEDPQPISLPTIQCELGRTELQTITLSNPLDEPALFSCDNSNTRHFIVTGLPPEGQVVVDPHSSADVSVIFNPSALGPSDHTTDLAFTSKQIGRQVFSLRGEGLPPTSMDPITINAAIDSNAVHIINFTNPLDHPTHFSVTLSGEDMDAFCLLLKRSSSILLHSGVSLDIPLMFAPEAVYRHSVTMAIVADMNRSGEDIADIQPLCWQYAVVGQPQLRPFSPGSAPKISCPAKERLENTVEVSLASSAASVQVTPSSSDTEVGSSGPAERSEGNDDYTFKLVCSDSQYEELVEQCTGLRLIRQTRQEDKKGVCLEFGIIFAPSKSFSCVCELQVTSTCGGMWLFPLHLSATPASPDDTIILEAKGLHQESRVGFRLTSGNQHPAPFTAHLTPGSDPDLVVSPTSGTLSPVNTKGTLFCITYKPTAYGRNHHATLIVQSETNEWRYKIEGQPPSYCRQAVPAKVQHKLDSPMRFIDTRRNFVTENIQNINVA